MKFASGFEIFEYCQLMAEQFGFYDHCLFHTEVTGIDWDDDAQRWTVSTDRGDAMRARFVMLANGILTTPRLARIDGHGDLRRPVVPHLPLGLRRRPRRASGSASSAPAPPRCRPSPSWPRWPATSTCSSARRPRSRCATSAAPPPRRSSAGATRTGLGASPAAPGSPRSSIGRGAIQADRRLPRGQGRDRPTPAAAEGPAARRSGPSGSSTTASGSWSRSATASTPSSKTPDRRRAQAVLPLRLQAADLPRRVPADVQPAQRHPRRRRPDRRALDQRAGRRPRRRAVRPRRVDLRHRLRLHVDRE